MNYSNFEGGIFSKITFSMKNRRWMDTRSRDLGSFERDPTTSTFYEILGYPVLSQPISTSLGQIIQIWQTTHFYTNTPSTPKLVLSSKHASIVPSLRRF